jgi:hypothetical protein
MKKKSARIFGFTLFLISIAVPLISLGQKQADECAAADWSKAEEIRIFGFLEQKGGSGIITSIAKTGNTKTVYQVSGEKSGKSIGYLNGGYVFVIALAIGIPDAPERCIKVKEILASGKNKKPDWSRATEVTLMGLLEPGKDNNIAIVTAWKSRSRVSNYVHGKYRNELEKQAGRFVKVKGLIAEQTDEPQTWSKNIVVLSIEALSDNPIE